MQIDALNRRLRRAKPQPFDKTIKLSERDLLIFEAIDRHGVLPSTYLYQFAKEKGDDPNRFQKRLTELYNGTKQQRPFLSRPEWQFNSYEARTNPLIYDLTPRGRKILAEHGRLARFSPRRYDNGVHQLMGACVSASIELACRKKHIRFVSKEEIFTHQKCPHATRESANPLAIEHRGLEPDNLFGFEYPQGGFRFFAVEIDRNTESIDSANAISNTFGKKINAYLDVFRGRMFKDRWGLPSLMLLTVTTSVTHMANIIDFLAKAKSPYTDRFLFKALPSFGTNWQVPKALLTDLLVEPWTRLTAPFAIDSA